MLNFEDALKIALNGGHTEEELNHCMEFEDYFFFHLKRKDGVRFLGGPACYVMKKDGKKYHNPMSFYKVLGKDSDNEKLLKEGYLEEFRKAN